MGATPKRKKQKGAGPIKPADAPPRGLWFAAGTGSPQAVADATAADVKLKQKASRAKVKNNPKLNAAARELRDRWLERVNSMPPGKLGKYEIDRQIAETIETGLSLLKKSNFSRPIQSPRRHGPAAGAGTRAPLFDLQAVQIIKLVSAAGGNHRNPASHWRRATASTPKVSTQGIPVSRPTSMNGLA